MNSHHNGTSKRRHPWHRTADVAEIITAFVGLRLPALFATAGDTATAVGTAQVLHLRRVSRTLDLAVSNCATRMLAADAVVGREHLLAARDPGDNSELPDVNELETELGRPLRLGMVDRVPGGLLAPVLSAALLAGREATAATLDAVFVRLPRTDDATWPSVLLRRLFQTHFALIPFHVFEGPHVAVDLLVASSDLRSVRGVWDRRRTSVMRMPGTVARPPHELPRASSLPALRFLALGDVPASAVEAAGLPATMERLDLSFAHAKDVDEFACQERVVESALLNLPRLRRLRVAFRVVPTGTSAGVGENVFRMLGDLPESRCQQFESVVVDTIGAMLPGFTNTELQLRLLRRFHNATELRVAPRLPLEPIQFERFVRDAPEHPAVRVITPLTLLASHQGISSPLADLCAKLPALEAVDIECPRARDPIPLQFVRALAPLRRLTTVGPRQALHVDAFDALTAQSGSTLTELPGKVYADEEGYNRCAPGELAKFVARCPALRDVSGTSNAEVAIAAREHNAVFRHLQSWRANLSDLHEAFCGPAMRRLALVTDDPAAVGPALASFGLVGLRVLTVLGPMPLTSAQLAAIAAACPSLRELSVAVDDEAGDAEPFAQALAGLPALSNLAVRVESKSPAAAELFIPRLATAMIRVAPYCVVQRPLFF